MLNFEVIVKRLEVINVSKLSEELNISRGTLIKIKSGNKSVNFEIVEKVSNYFEEHQQSQDAASEGRKD